MDVKDVINSAKHLNSKDRAFLAHCLISSLENDHESNVDQIWAELAKERFEELISGNVSSLPWNEVKRKVLS